MTGTYQGDPLSSMIFLTCFNAIIGYIIEKYERFGYEIKKRKEDNSETDEESIKIVTTPFADDINIITKNKIQHQRFNMTFNQK